MHSDLHEHRGQIDMQKIMMAVLTALQEERDRLAAEAEDEAAGEAVETPT